MVHQRDDLAHAPQRRVERDFVEILDHHIVVVRGEILRVVAASEEWVGLTIANPVDIDALQIHTRGRVSPGAAEKIDAVSTGYDATEDFPEVNLGAACLWIFVVL